MALILDVEIRDTNYIIDAHWNYARKESKKFRKFDLQTPYYTHPLWCATTISTETNLDKKIRKEGIITLLYHDILEDTTRELPFWLNDRVKYLVNEMTFENGNAQEMEEIWSKDKEIRLYKLYDKISNLLDGSWMDDEKRKIYEEYTKKLCLDVKENHGELNIFKFFKLNYL